MVHKSTALLLVGFLFGLVIIVAAAYLLRSEPVTDYQTTRDRQDQIEDIVQGREATLEFGVVSPVVSGSTFTLPLMVSSPALHVVGVDAVIEYNPELIEIVSVDKGPAFDRIIALDTTSTPGTITFSALTSPESEGLMGDQTVATITARAVSPGTANMAILYSPNDRNDSNVTSSELPGEDVLNGALPVSITIQ